MVWIRVNFTRLFSIGKIHAKNFHAASIIFVLIIGYIFSLLLETLKGNGSFVWDNYDFSHYFKVLATMGKISPDCMYPVCMKILTHTLFFSTTHMMTLWRMHRFFQTYFPTDSCSSAAIRNRDEVTRGIAVIGSCPNLLWEIMLLYFFNTLKILLQIEVYTSTI